MNLWKAKQHHLESPRSVAEQTETAANGLDINKATNPTNRWDIGDTSLSRL